MAIAIQSLILNFAAMQVFLVCNIRDSTFSDRNTSFYHMTWELIVTKISIFIGVSIRHSKMIKVNHFKTIKWKESNCFCNRFHLQRSNCVLDKSHFLISNATINVSYHSDLSTNVMGLVCCQS